MRVLIWSGYLDRRLSSFVTSSLSRISCPSRPASRRLHSTPIYAKEHLFSIPSEDVSVIESARPATGIWAELQQWRAAAVDERRGWQRRRPTDRVPSPGHHVAPSDDELPDTLAACGVLVLSTGDPLRKAELSHAAYRRWRQGSLPVGTGAAPARPARPEHPRLVRPREVPTPRDSPLPAPVYTLHNLAHIELNAVDLAWDTIVRFSDLDLPHTFYGDFAKIADEEARHFGWTYQRLRELGHTYGDMVAHDILWEGAELSSEDAVGRLAVINMTQEARGLDAGPRLALRLQGLGDPVSAAIVDRISLEEKAHVAVGVYWFRRICAALHLDATEEFRTWAYAQGSEVLKGPFNDHARALVGMDRTWYDVTSWRAEDREKLRSGRTWDAIAVKGSGPGGNGEHEAQAQAQAQAQAPGVQETPSGFSAKAAVPALSRGREWAALRGRLAGLVLQEAEFVSG